MPELDVSRVSIFNSHAAAVQTKDGKKSKELRRGEKTGRTVFSLLRELDGENAKVDAAAAGECDLSALIDEVHSCGDSLKRHPVSGEVERYKRAVKNFIGFVVSRGFTVQERDGILNRYKPRYKDRVLKPEERNRRNRYKNIAVIDQKLEQLAAGIMSGQTAQLAILARIDEITGLVIDLLN